MKTSCMEAHAVWMQLGAGSGGGTQKERANRLRLVPPFHRKGAAAVYFTAVPASSRA